MDGSSRPSDSSATGARAGAARRSSTNAGAPLAAALLVALVAAPAEAATAVVLLLPPAGSAVGPDGGAGLAATLRSDLAARPGITVTSLPEGAELDDASCLRDEACASELGAAAGATHVLVVLVDGTDASRQLDASLLSLAGDAPRRVSRLLAESPTTTNELRLSVASLVAPFSTATGRLSVVASEDDAAIFVDGAPLGASPIERAPVTAGAHVVTVTADGFEAVTRAVEVPADGAEIVEVKLVPTAEYLESYVATAWTLRVTSLLMLGVGTVDVLIGAGALGASYVLAGMVSEAIRAHNADPDRTAEQQSALETQALLVNVATVAGAAALAAGVVLTGAGIVLFFVGDSPGRYDE